MFKVRFIVYGLILAPLAACTNPDYRPSSQSVQAVRALRDIEHAGQYMTGAFNPCGPALKSKKSGFNAGLELDEDGNITPTAQIRTVGKC